MTTSRPSPPRARGARLRVRATGAASRYPGAAKMNVPARTRHRKLDRKSTARRARGRARRPRGRRPPRPAAVRARSRSRRRAGRRPGPGGRGRRRRRRGDQPVPSPRRAFSKSARSSNDGRASTDGSGRFVNSAINHWRCALHLVGSRLTGSTVIAHWDEGARPARLRGWRPPDSLLAFGARPMALLIDVTSSSAAVCADGDAVRAQRGPPRRRPELTVTLFRDRACGHRRLILALSCRYSPYCLAAWSRASICAGVRSR